MTKSYSQKYNYINKVLKLSYLFTAGFKVIKLRLRNKKHQKLF